MARKLDLTWQAGIGGRVGRWRKKFLGKPYYFDGGRGKTDREAYARAVEAWQNKKRELMEQDSKPHESDYLDALREWRAVRDWSAANDDQATLGLSRGKIKELEARLASRRPPPIDTKDRFEARFTPVLIDIDEFIGRKDDLARIDWSRIAGLQNADGSFLPSPETIEASDGSPMRIAKEIWRDRIATQLRQSDVTHAPATIEGNVARFLAQKRTQVDGDDLSVGRFSNLKHHLSLFRDFVGGSNPVSAITSRIMTDFRTSLLEKKVSGELSGSYAKDRLDAAKQFTRWLWREETLADLPRVIESKTFSISPSVPVIKTLTIDEIKTLLAAASGQMKLFILLGLNAGFTQGDISDLQNDEVDWQAGVIRRKRSKTKNFENVPEVAYKLWPETVRLLRESRCTDGTRVLANENGGALVTSKLRDDDGHRKIDNIHTGYYRLCCSVDIKGRSFRSMRKTSATLLRGSDKYSGLEDLFLGHAPRSMSGKHYAGIPHDLLASAVKWLGQEYGLIADGKQPKSQNRQLAKRESQPARSRTKKGAKVVATNPGR